MDVAAGISVFFDFDMQLEKIEHYLQNKKIVGIKLFTGHEAFSLADERLEEVYRLAVRYQIPVLFHSGGEGNWYADVKLAAELAGKYSDLKLVCCHCYYPEIEKSLELLAYPNIFFDLSSVADQEILIPDVVKVIRKMAETAPERILFGSDYSGCSQSRHIDLVRELQLTKEEEENIFWKNAEKLYGLRKELR